MTTMTRYRDDAETLNTRWITLGQACKLLGVNESTLRRWADAGHTRSFRTPAATAASRKKTCGA